VDDATATYIAQTRKCFDDLRQVAAQLAGVLVLAEAGGKSATPDHPMLKAAAELHREAVDQIRSKQPSAAARSHYDFLSQAAQSLAVALAAASGRRLQTSAMLAPVREAYSYLARASDALPGFPMVAFEQACCAVHVHS
jgi:hypothetical protein